MGKVEAFCFVFNGGVWASLCVAGLIQRAEVAVYRNVWENRKKSPSVVYVCWDLNMMRHGSQYTLLSEIGVFPRQ